MTEEERDRRLEELRAAIEAQPPPDLGGYRFMEFAGRYDECPRGPHRGPQGPNEDLAQCPLCLSMHWGLRPEDETYGDHADDCSLPMRHVGYCVGGGSGHAVAGHVRGYFPSVAGLTQEDTE